MNRERLRNSIQGHEGYRSMPYFCSEGAATVGWGHNIHRDIIEHSQFGPLLEYYSDPANHRIWLESDIDIAIDRARRWIGAAWDDLSDIRQEVLAEMAFQLGNRIRKFIKTAEFIRTGYHDKAADEMLNSRWAEQTPTRAQTLAHRYRLNQYSEG